MPQAQVRSLKATLLQSDCGEVKGAAMTFAAGQPVVTRVGLWLLLVQKSGTWMQP